MEKDSLLLNYSFVTYMDRKDHTTENCKYEELSNKIEEQICKVIGKDDDDDDEEDRLFPAALAGVAMVGGLAMLGGTIGYFSSTSKAPIGLMSGYVEPNWGVLLHVAINKQVFGNKRGPENLIAGVTGFYNVFNSQVQPAIGIGARITEEGTDEAILKPSLSIGFVGNFGQFVLLAGYDVSTPDFRFGIGVNLRHSK